MAEKTLEERADEFWAFEEEEWRDPGCLRTFSDAFADFARQVANEKLEEAAKAIDAHAECYSQSQSYPTFQSDIENMAEEIRALKFPEGE